MKRAKTIQGKLLPGALAAALSCLAAAPAHGASTTVNIVDFAFNPSTVNINVHDSVIWNWVGPTTHTSTSDTGDTTAWNSGFMNATAARFTNTFAASGSFPYHCTIHPFMTASVTVQGSVQTNVPPTVSITSPTNGAVFTAPWTGTITASSADSDGTVTQLQFWAGTALLRTVANPPASASITVTNLAAGSYTLTAVATDNGGATNRSAAVSITVGAAAGPITLSSVLKPSATSFQFSYGTTPGKQYIIQRSANLQSWSSLATNSASGSQQSFTDAAASAGASFYRVKLAGP